MLRRGCVKFDYARLFCYVSGWKLSKGHGHSQYLAEYPLASRCSFQFSKIKSRTPLQNQATGHDILGDLNSTCTV